MTLSSIPIIQYDKYNTQPNTQKYVTSLEYKEYKPCGHYKVLGMRLCTQCMGGGWGPDNSKFPVVRHFKPTLASQWSDQIQLAKLIVHYQWESWKKITIEKQV